jgi:TusA-related sulfurtransferase
MTSTAVLDLRGVKCPLNFVKAKLALEKLPPQGQLTIWLDDDPEAALNVPTSIQQEGHTLLDHQRSSDDPEGKAIGLVLVIERKP